MHFHEAIWLDFQQAASWWTTVQAVLGAPWLQNLILAITAAIGLGTLGASSRQERRRATVDVLLENLDDQKFLDARKKVRALLKPGLDIKRLLSDEGAEDRRQVLSILNRYEFMAAGLRERAFDRKIYQRMYYSNVVSDWNDLESFVRALREDRHTQTLFQEVEALVIEWKKHPLEAYSKKPATAVGTSAPCTSAGKRPAPQTVQSCPSPSDAKAVDGEHSQEADKPTAPPAAR